MSPELDLLLSCAGVVISGREDSRARSLVTAGVDWTGLAQRAVTQGLAGLVGVGLSRVAADLVPGELLDAFAVALQSTRNSNEALLQECSVLGEALGREVDAIELKGPAFVQATYGDLGFRACRDLELLVREADLAATLTVLGRLGFRRGDDLLSQRQATRGSGGSEVLIKDAEGAAIKVHTHLGSGAMALDLDYAGLCKRAKRTGNAARGLWLLAAEDALLALALEGAEEIWGNLRRVCDVAALIGSHPRLDWEALLERARAQGCLRKVLLAASLARHYLRAAVPAAVVTAQDADPAIEGLTEGAPARWDGTAPSTAGSALDAEWLQLNAAERREASASETAPAWLTRAESLFAVQRFADAAAATDRALTIEPDHIGAQRLGIRARIFAYDWSRHEEEQRRISTALKAGQRVISPDNHRVIGYSEEENLTTARLHGARYPQAQALWRGERYQHQRIRIAYKSTDFRVHPVGNGLVGCFEHHDKQCFETFAISLRPSDGSRVRQRIETAFDHFIDAENMSDEEIARMLREREVDIAIDLNGYAAFGRAGRTGVFAHRPAPVQVNYFGYPGTLGLEYFDYILADRTVIPEENRIHYSERVVYLPDTYQPTDRNGVMPESTPSRSEAGLPATGFVFACHNNTFKIRPEIFDIWMRILGATEDSVLWLLEDNPRAPMKLRGQAAVRGIAPQRIVFAPLRPHRDYLARLRLADLCLDTLPYNAHTTACDALWMGLPVVTCPGETFPARVAASLLKAVGLPELITKSLADYEALAVALARDPARLAAIRARLVRNRQTEPLFDTARFTHHIEAAFRTMWERQQAGRPPASFAVEAIDTT